VKPLIVDLETVWRGGQNQALLLLKGLQERGHEPELVAAKGSALAERARACAVPVHVARPPLVQWQAARALRRGLGERPVSLVHANEAHALTAAWLARAHRSVPLVVSRRVGYPLKRDRLASARYRAASRIIANSRWVAEQAEASGVHREKLVVVYEGVEIPAATTAEARQAARARWGLQPGAPLLGCVGVLLPDKGQEWLIRAVASLRFEFPECRLLLAGDGPWRPRLQQLARELGVLDAVTFAGFVGDIESIYAALDVFLLPSFFDALNNSLLAAMAHQLPCVAFAKGALPEIIEHEKSGLLVSGPNVAEISAGVARLLNDPARARALGLAARHRVAERFSATQMVEGTLRIYREVLSRNVPCGGPASTART
jgi:glycosyltransferase involved in cell wall biosynthesis